MKKLWTLALVLICFRCYGQQKSGNDEAEINAVIEQFFEALNAQDTASLRSIISPNTHFFVWIITSNDTITRRGSHDQWLESLVDPDLNLLERYWNVEIKIHQGIATVWTDYDFYVNNSFSHCGGNVFGLIKTDSGWKITDTLFTSERECAPSPLPQIQEEGSN
ncbi:MAG: nuclear transport factor 2 family protein [Bacteroidia bacterium]